MSSEQQVPTARRPRLLSLYVIYDADGTFTGELIYSLKKLLGIAHCAACDITHGPRREKPEFTNLKQEYGWNVPLHNIHRDEVDTELRKTVEGQLPCVAARTTKGDTILLEASVLEECSGSVGCLKRKVDDALKLQHVQVPGSRIGECDIFEKQVEDLVGISGAESASVPTSYSPIRQESDAVVPL